MAHFIDVKLSSLKIEKNYIKRTPPRKVEDQQKNYLELFDFDTIFSDIFFTGNKDIQFLGPPLINLKNELLNGEISINDVRINDLNFHDKNRITRTVYPFKEKLDNIPTFISFQNNLCSGSIQVQPNLSSFFKNRNVLVTQQKNNSLYWIAYWIAFHVQFHKIDAVIIYDNSSEYYSLNDIKKIINLFPEIKVSSVIDWSIPWGPTGGPKGIWDSDYGQHQSWEHALSRFLLDANCAIFGDIDEYPVSKNNRAIPDILSSIDEPVLSYKRRQIVEVNKENFINHGVRLPCDTGYYEPSKSEIAPKYAIKPKLINNGQLMAHTVLNTPCYNCSDIISRHMGNMRLDWRNDRFELIKLKSISDYSELEFDKELDSTFNQVNLDWLTKLDLRK